MKRDDPEGPHGKWLPAAQLVQASRGLQLQFLWIIPTTAY